MIALAGLSRLVTGAAYAALIVTPFCGWAFGCGCDWPWWGLADHCNVHDASAVHRCPWCVEPLTGGLVVIGAMALGCVASAYRPQRAWIRRLAGGLGVPLMFLFFAAGATAIGIR